MFSDTACTEEEGQSLVEYSLVLVFIAIVVVVILALFGSTLKGSYCKTVHLLTPDADLSGVCRAPIVNPILVDQGPSTLNIEVQIFDPDGNPSNPYAAITHVEFYIDDTGSGPVHTEYYYRYCLGGNSGTNPCRNRSISGLSSGRHSITILAYDADGNIGRGSYTFTK